LAGGLCQAAIPSTRMLQTPASPTASAAAEGGQHDWACGWDAHPLTAASPRWTFGNSDKMKVTRKNQPISKQTYMDHHTKSVAWVPGPGTHRTRRNFEPYPEDDATDPDSPYAKGIQRQPRWQDVCDRQVYHRFSKTTRTASVPDLRKIRTTLLPTSFLSPGPGAYTAFSTFGSPSGPTRKRYFATSKSDIIVNPRPIEEFKNDSQRGMEGRNFSQQRKQKHAQFTPEKTK